MPHRLLLVGLGHAHLELIQQMRRDRHALDHFQISALTSPPPQGTPEMIYTGMITDVLAGQQTLSAAKLPSGQLAHQADISVIESKLARLDPINNIAWPETGPPLPFDLLSLAIGSSTNQLPEDPQAITPPSQSTTQRPETIAQVPLRPIETLVKRLDDAFALQTNPAQSCRLTVVGDGWGGLEAACCLAAPSSPWHDRWQHPITLLGNSGPAVRFSSARRAVANHPIHWIRRRAVAVTHEGVKLDNGDLHPTNIAVIATGPAPQPELSQWGLPTLRDGFLATEQTLQVVGHPHILALGDTAGGWYPRSGVHAIRQGRLAWKNLKRLVRDKPPRRYRATLPRLQLANLGDGSALAHWGPLCFRARWALWLKRAIDQHYVNTQHESPKASLP